MDQVLDATAVFDSFDPNGCVDTNVFVAWVYRERWKEKLRWYRDNGVLPLEEGGGELATLVVTYDDERGGIDGREIAR